MGRQNHSADKESRAGRARLFISRFFVYVVILFLVVLCLFSFYILIINATRSDTQITRDFSLLPGKSFSRNLAGLRARTDIPVVTALINSLIIAVCCSALTTYFSALTAYAIQMYDFKLKKYAFSFIMLVMMVPTQVSTLGFIQLISKIGLMDSFIPLIVPAIASPVTFFFMKQYMESVLPAEIVEAARVDGSHEFRTFNTIVLPIIKPAIAVQAIFAFVASWNNYFVPNLVIESDKKKTIPIIMALLRSSNWQNQDEGVKYVLICIAIMPVMIVYFILSKQIVAGVTMGSVKG